MSNHLPLHSPSPPPPPQECKEEPMSPMTSKEEPPSPESEETLVNGTSTSPPVTQDAGGRLKFFLDGKFVLELSHHHEGNRRGWVPVSRKTYWPPVSRPGGGASSTATVPSGLPIKQESSTSHSDDNSSLRSVSSPWLREHRIKQSAPHRGQGRYLPTFSLVLPRTRRSGPHWKRLAWKRRRKPFVCDPETDCDPLLWAQLGLHTGIPQPQRTKSIELLVKRLTQQQQEKKLVVTGPAICHPSASKKVDSSIVSPRKRILRQMEAEKGRKRGSASTSATPHSSNYSIRTLLSNKKPSETSPALHRLLEARLESEQYAETSRSNPLPYSPCPPAHLLSSYLSNPFGFIGSPAHPPPHLMHPGALANPFQLPLHLQPIHGYSPHWRSCTPLMNDKGRPYTATSSATSTREIEAPLNLSKNGRRRDHDC